MDGSHVWSKQFGTGLGSGNGIGVDGSGNLFITGYCIGTTDFGGGAVTGINDYGAFLVKLSASGAHVWSKRFPGSYDDYGNGVAVSGSGNVVVTGYFPGTIDFGSGSLSNLGG